VNDALRQRLTAQLGSRVQTLPDGRLQLSPRDDAELRLIVSQFHRAGEPLIPAAELVRSALSSVGPVQVKSGLVEAGAGATVGDIDRAAETLGLTVGPLSPKALELELATFLEGPYAGLRPVLGGRLEPLALAIEAILPDGILYVSRPAPRSAAGPDLDALLLGGEGRFGWVSRATLRLLPRPAVRQRVVYSFGAPEALCTAARYLLAAGCNVQLGWAQTKGSRILLELELGGSPDTVERDLSTCSHHVAEAGGRASGQTLDDAPHGEERELSWQEVCRELELRGRLSLHRLSVDGVIAMGATRGRTLAPRQPWDSAGLWDRIAEALAPPSVEEGR
jgi:hypothetical protein